MQRVHMGRIGTALAAACLIGGIANRDAFAAMAKEASEPRTELLPGEIRLNLDLIGTNAVLRFPTETGSAEDITYRKCSYDRATEQRLCVARTNGDASRAIGLTLRDRSGHRQTAFDSLTTDTVVVRQGRYADAPRGSDGDSSSRSFRSTRRYAGVSVTSDTRVLDGVDTVYTTFSYPKQNRHVSSAHTVTYSNVTVANSRRGEVVFPTAGVIHASGVSDVSGANAARNYWLNVTVLFDGTRTPEAYIGGKRFVLDLTTGIATPKPIA